MRTELNHREVLVIRGVLHLTLSDPTLIMADAYREELKVLHRRMTRLLSLCAECHQDAGYIDEHGHRVCVDHLHGNMSKVIVISREE